MDRFGPTGKVSKKLVHLFRCTSFPDQTGLNLGWMDRALRIVPHMNSHVTLLAKGQFSALRALACFKISLTQLCLRRRHSKPSV